MSENFSQNRILKNTILLYVRMLFTMWLNLYATRLVLANLGVEDMGIYGVVGSVVSIFTVFTSGITSAVQRYIAFELGKKDGQLNSVFCSSLNVIFLLCIALFLFLEIGGTWLLNNKVNIPADRLQAASWVYQLSILTCLVNLISIPYNALIIAHEKMGAFAGISILQTILSCAAAYCISYVDGDRMLWYALFMALVSVLIRVFYQGYCHFNFEEARYRMIIDRGLIKGIGKFTGVSTISNLLQIVISQGLVFVINWTFGVAINAVYNIALQLKNSILSFALNINRAISPQITKTYASGEMEKHLKLVYIGSKMEVFLIYFIMIPFLFRTEYILHLWLGNVPQYTVEFTRCTVFISLTYALFEPIRSAVYATERIFKFLVIPDTFNLLVLPVGYVISRWLGSPVLLIASVVGFDVVACAIRVFYGCKVSSFTIRELMNKTFYPCFFVAIASSLVCWGLVYVTAPNISGLIILLIVNSIFLFGFIYIFGMTASERNMVKAIIFKVQNRR